MRQGRRAGLLWGMCALVGAVGACETSRNPGQIVRDQVPPNIQLTTSADTQDIAGGLNFGVTATDNLGLKDIQLTYTGGYIKQTDTVFTTTVTNVNIQEKINPGSGSGGVIRIVGRATDGAGNFAEDTIFIFLQNVDALRVYLLQPTAGAVASSGKYIPIQVAAAQKSGVKRIGWLVGGNAGQTAQTGDALVNGSPPFPDTLDFVDSVQVTGTTGFFTVAGFAVDSGGRVSQTSPITVTILSAANDVTPPQIQQTVSLRAEANDTLAVHATDPSGISVIGFRVFSIAGTLIRQDSVLLSGTSTDVVKKFAMGLTSLTPIPQQVVIQAFACDAAVAHNCGVTGQTFTVPSPSGAARMDTVTIVAGATIALPFGGKIVDAIYNANRRELYLTNPTLSRVEIFQAANSSFVAAGIPTAGPQPWGIALWPRDTLGAYGDSIVVANSGGTQMSIIDVSPARVLRWRQDLPDFLIQTYRWSLCRAALKWRSPSTTSPTGRSTSARCAARRAARRARSTRSSRCTRRRPSRPTRRRSRAAPRCGWRSSSTRGTRPTPRNCSGTSSGRSRTRRRPPRRIRCASSSVAGRRTTQSRWSSRPAPASRRSCNRSRWAIPRSRATLGTSPMASSARAAA